MRLTAIIEDGIIIVDGAPRRVVMPVCDANWTAIQWYGTYGTVEVKVGERVWLENDTALAPFVAAWELAAPPSNSEATGVVEL
jgi:hypothetical protein